MGGASNEAPPMFRFVVSIEEAHMNIQQHFQQETIEKNQVILDDLEEEELSEYLDVLIQMQREDAREDEPYLTEEGKSLAGLAFVAGRSYEKENAEQVIQLLTTQLEIHEEQEEGVVVLRIRPQTAAKLIEFLLGED